MSIRTASRRWGLPAVVLVWLFLPLLVAGCPWDDLPEDVPFWFSCSDVPQSCKECYAELADIEYVAELDLDNDGQPDGLPEPGGAELLGAPGTPLPGVDPEDPSADPPGTATRPRLPDAVTRPRVDPNLSPNAPSSPSYPGKPPTSPKGKY